MREEFLDGLDLLRTAGDPGWARTRAERSRTPRETRVAVGEMGRRRRPADDTDAAFDAFEEASPAAVGVFRPPRRDRWRRDWWRRDCGAAAPAPPAGARPRGISSPAPARRGGLRGEDGDVEHRTATFQRVRRRVRPTTREVQTRGVFRPNGREDALFRHRLCRRRGGQRTRGGGGGGSSERGRGVDKRTDDRGAKTPSRRRLG